MSPSSHAHFTTALHRLIVQVQAAILSTPDTKAAERYIEAVYHLRRAGVAADTGQELESRLVREIVEEW